MFSKETKFLCRCLCLCTSGQSVLALIALVTETYLTHTLSIKRHQRERWRVGDKGSENERVKWLGIEARKVTLEKQSTSRGKKKKLIKNFHLAITGWRSRPLSLWAKKSAERLLALQSLSCKSAAVQNMTATALAGPLRGVEHFQGNDLKNDNAGSCVILIIPCTHGK